MRLVSVNHHGERRPGILIPTTHGDRFLDVSHIAGDIETILSNDELARAVRDAITTAPIDTLPTAASLRLLAPVVPSKILCLGYNYRGHTPDGVSAAQNDPAFPDVFIKTANTLSGPNDPVVIPAGATDVDYEGELAIVIGRRARQVALDHALEHVGGYSILNDVSERSWQRQQSQWALGKCADGFAPLGPWIVPADEIPDPQNLLVEVERDGVVTVSQSTSTTIFSVAFVIHHLSHRMTLNPGDVITTGSPQKLPDADADYRPLAPGDAVTVRISGIGELTTVFTAPDPTGTPEVSA